MRRAERDRAFSEFYLAHAIGLRRTAYLVVHDWHLAEDLTQQGLAKLYAAWGRTRSDTRLAYARRIVVNECLSHLRRRRPETPTDQLPDRAQPERAGDVDLSAALALLPARQRAIVALRFLDDLPVVEVARVLGIAEGTVKSQTARALETLRSRVDVLVPATNSEESR
ncbi:MAG TPA: SigE family RNA polymerase sigma factor [Nocardioides sp.]|nr:SigE family RNA polymerase sigma factor [Nocardioides sp.]